MSAFSTPVRKNKVLSSNPVTIPPSPFLQRLGYGTGVAVYKLERSPVANRIQSPWAIKKLLKSNVMNKSTFQDRLKQEADTLRKLNHPNIIGFRAFITTNTKEDCLAMEECNTSLGDLIEVRKEQELEAFPANTIMKVALDISEALNYLHNKALILHGDVKSYNILVDGNFNVCKLCDFGVSLALTATGDLDHTEGGNGASYIGSRLWSAPEVLSVPQRITSKADIFSYGLSLWEMLSLVPPRIEAIDESSFASDNSFDGSMESSFTSTGYSEELNSSAFTKRPELPPQEFDDSYKYVLEIYHCCTEAEANLRPSALDLTISIPQMISELKVDN